MKYIGIVKYCIYIFIFTFCLQTNASTENENLHKNNFESPQRRNLKKHRKNHLPLVRHRQSISNGSTVSYRRNFRQSKLVNIADNWDRIPYILQTYK